MSDWRLTPQNTALVVIDVQEKLMNGKVPLDIEKPAELDVGITAA